jgi:hypothetical protein
MKRFYRMAERQTGSTCMLMMFFILGVLGFLYLYRKIF